jgi:hypothetical protein
MSWSIAVVGEAGTLRPEIVRQFERAGTLSEPEESLKRKAWALVLAAVDAQDKSEVVKVEASGYECWDCVTHVDSHVLRIAVEPQTIFIE